MNAILTQQLVRELFDYEPHTGELIAKVGRSKLKAGKVAGKIDHRGYRALKIYSRNHLAHRVIWLHVYGEWPSLHIDHINGDKSDNRLSNLRQADNFQNMMNRGPNTGRRFKGVTYNKSVGKYQACISGKYLGLFETDMEAAQAYDAACLKLHGEFARPNMAALEARQ